MDGLNAINLGKLELLYKLQLGIIQAPGHEIDTLNMLCSDVYNLAAKLQQTFVVLTVDQALYCKLLQLKWLVPEYQDKLIPRLGGFHTSLNFLKVIGQHMASCGLVDVWIESGILGPHSCEQIMAN